VLGLSSCSDDGAEEQPASTTTGTGTTTTDDGTVESTGPKLDTPGDTDSVTGCAGDGECTMIDLLFVIDNSGTMGEEQLNLAANFPLLVDRLRDLEDAHGNKLNPSVNIMVTTTDFGHPLCTPHHKDGYVPQQGAPVYEGCNSREPRFTGFGSPPLTIFQACTQNCPADIEPGDQFIHFDAEGSNVPGDDVGRALSCIGPQGIDGCGYEAPLESMLQAINPEACWNDPEKEGCADHPEWGQFDEPFLRDGAILAVAIITDEVECSVRAPDGFSWFTNEMQSEYWETPPNSETPAQSSAICWNAGVTCVGPDATGEYSDCVPADNDVLHPISRYVDYLTFLREERDKEVVMLGILGVPPVTAHNPMPPYQPTAGGVDALVYRAWKDTDILPQEVEDGVEVEDKVFEFGNIAPGCVGLDAVSGTYTGVAIPNTRVIEVCQSLDIAENPDTTEIEAATRCCIESICSQDFSLAIECLAGAIGGAVETPG
jgi:hypothetical protein